MKSKSVITIALIAFVCVCVVFLMAKESKSRIPAEELDIKTTDSGVEISKKPSTVDRNESPANNVKAENESAAVPSHKIIATYYHANKRCKSCNIIGTLSELTFVTKFKKEMMSGDIEFHLVNYDEPENKHFYTDYKMTSQSLILSEVVDGAEKRWVNLEKVWPLLNNKDKFIKYVEDETREFMRNGE